MFDAAKPALTVNDASHRQRSERDTYPDNLALRVHRAPSWLNRAEQLGTQSDADGQFIFLWIAFNAAYASRRWSGKSSRTASADDVDLSAEISWDNDNTRYFDFVIGVKQAVWNVPRWEPDGDPSWVLDAHFFADVPVNFGFLIDGVFGSQSRPGAPVRIEWSGRGGDHLVIGQSLLPEPGALGLAAAGLLMLAGLRWTGREQKRIHEHR